jgi:hypothetical protein
VYIDPIVVEYYEFAEASWQKYSTFLVEIYIDGTLYHSATMNTECGKKNIVINTPKGSILIKNLGRLEGDYSPPQVSDIMIFDEKHVYNSEAIRYIRYDHGRTIKYWPTDWCQLCYIEGSNSFSTYWWGTVRWNSKAVDEEVADTPAPFKSPDGYYPIANPEKGWKITDDAFDYIREPVAPTTKDIFSYLNKMTSSGNIASKWLGGYSWSVEEKDGKPYAVVVELPWSAYSGSPMVTFFIPSELVDTWVYHAAISDIRIEKVEWVNENSISANGKKEFKVTVKQYANVESSATLSLKTSTSRASVFPASVTVTLGPNKTKTLTFKVFNNGVNTEIEGNVFISVKRSWDGVETSSARLSFKLLPSKLPENLPDVIDRTDKTDPLEESSFGDSNIVWIVLILCVTAIIVILLIVTRDEKRKKAAAKMAKTGFKQTKNIAIKIVRPVWRRYTVPLATIILGLALLLGISILQLLPFRLLPLYIEVIMMVIGFLLIVLGTFSLISSTIFGSKKDKIITLSDFVKERKEKKEK